MEISLKTRGHAIPESRFFVELTIKDASVCDAELRVAEIMVDELTVYAATNVVEFFVQTFVALQTTPALDLGVVMWLYKHLWPSR